MDIAKIRKKSKEDTEKDQTAQEPLQSAPASDAAVPGTEPPQEIAVPVTGGQEAAKTTEPPAPSREDTLIELLTFSLGDEEYAFRIEDIYEIIRTQRITPIPKSKHYIIGVTSLRGKIIPVIDLKKMLSLNSGRNSVSNKQKILIMKGARGPIGALTDRVIGVVRPAMSKIAESPPHLNADETRFIEGVTLINGRFISILRPEETIDISFMAEERHDGS